MHVLVTGASGAIGSRLVPALLSQGHAVRCLTRRAERLDAAPWRPDVEVAVGDVADWISLEPAMDGVTAAYYLVHGLGVPLDRLLDHETRQAATFRDAAERAGLSQIVYLGGLLDDAEVARVSPHMYARQQVGVTLAAAGTPVTELRAGIVIGPGSASFRMLLGATRLPIVLRTGWSTSRCQPIAMVDAVHYLAGVLGQHAALDRTFDIGGPEVLTYHRMIRIALEVTGGTWRPSAPLPASPPEASAPLAAALAGIDQRVALALLQSARHDAVVTDGGAIRGVVAHRPMGFRDAVTAALAEMGDALSE